MKPEEMLIKVPWSDVVKIIVMLVKFSKGGISKEEGKILTNALLELVCHVSEGAIDVESKAK